MDASVFGDRDCDPISLEPLSELEYPPFGLQEQGVWHFFDGAVLATYLVSTATFCNPMTRTPLTRDDCRALDEYLLENGLRAGLKDVLVTHAYDLLEMTRKGQDVGAMISRSQREATTVLNSLFGFSRSLILLFTSPDQVVLTQAWNALNSVTKTLDTSDQMAHVADVRQAVRFAVADLRYHENAPSLMPGFCLPKGIT